LPVHATEDCSDPGPATIPNMACAPGVSAAAFDLDFVGACPVSNPALPVGDVAPLDPVTYCCASVP
jgi:hypothetical protein